MAIGWQIRRFWKAHILFKRNKLFWPVVLGRDFVYACVALYVWHASLIIPLYYMTFFSSFHFHFYCIFWEERVTQRWEYYSTDTTLWLSGVQRVLIKTQGSLVRKTWSHYYLTTDTCNLIPFGVMSKVTWFDSFLHSASLFIERRHM